MEISRQLQVATALT